MENTTIDTTSLREKNPDSPWLFPIRMENSARIEWKENIVEAISAFKAPITEATWISCVRRKLIAAETPEEQQRLEQWWSTGWRETPTLPNAATKPIPIMAVRQNALGETLEAIYPTNNIALKALGCHKKQLARMCNGEELPMNKGIKLIPMREKNVTVLGLVEGYKWTLFAPDNTVIAQSKTLKNIAEYLQLTYRQTHYAYTRHNGIFSSGMWMWNDEHGLTPIAPDGNFLPEDWRESLVTPNTIILKQGIVNF